MTLGFTSVQTCLQGAHSELLCFWPLETGVVSQEALFLTEPVVLLEMVSHALCQEGPHQMLTGCTWQMKQLSNQVQCRFRLHSGGTY